MADKPDVIYADMYMGVWMSKPQPDRIPEPPTAYIRKDLTIPAQTLRLVADALKNAKFTLAYHRKIPLIKVDEALNEIQPYLEGDAG